MIHAQSISYLAESHQQFYWVCHHIHCKCCYHHHTHCNNLKQQVPKASQHNLPKALMHQKSSTVLGLEQQQDLGMGRVALSQNKELNIQGMLHIETAKKLLYMRQQPMHDKGIYHNKGNNGYISTIKTTASIKTYHPCAVLTNGIHR
jgi:hypothetical protein